MKHSISTKQSPIGIRAILSPCSTRGRKGTGLFNQVFKGFVPMRSRVKHGNGVGFLFFLLFALSCTEAEVADELRPAPGQEVDASFNLQVLASQTTQTRSITFTAEGAIESDSLGVDTAAPDAVIPAAPDSLQTKSATPLSEVLENKLSTLWVGQYDATTGAHMFSQYLATLSATTDNTVYLKLKANETGHTSRVYFVANTSNLGEVADTTTLKNKTLQFNSTAEGLPGNNLCMMIGQWNGTVPLTGMSNINVDIRRLVAKISFTYAISGANFSFTLDSVSLKNAPILSQVAAPTTQLTGTGMSYKDYTDKYPASTSKTFYWYLPENMAGTVTGSNAVTSEKLKIGTGVTNATCIELAGSAVQDGVSYNDVVIRFFPGANMNNYDVVRNAHYQMNVTLVGLDISDNRITIGEIPPVEVDTGKMLAEKGSEKTVQIPARPGISWVLDLPPWLSALVDGTTAPAGSTIKYDGPVLVTLQAAEANPKAEDRTETVKLSIDNTSNNFQFTQAGSSLTTYGNITLDAAGTKEGSTTFSATKGLPWTANLSDSWIVWASTTATPGDATGEKQTLSIKAPGPNPLGTQRAGKITLKAGASIIEEAGYTALVKDITVTQAASTLTGSTVNNVAAAGSTGSNSSFTATAGLPWTVDAVGYDWISITSGTSGDATAGSAQSVAFNVGLNPNPDPRAGSIHVRAGDPARGPEGQITVNQQGSTFNVTPATLSIAHTGGTPSVTVNGTSGLVWTVSPTTTTNGITPTTTNSTANGGNQSLEFQVAKNTGRKRSAEFTVSVPAGNHPPKKVVVTQEADPAVPIIDQDLLRRYAAIANDDLTTYPPFDMDGTNQIINKYGITYTPNGASSTMSGSYAIQVEGRQNSKDINYATAQTYCANLTEDGTGWRVPTLIELFAMWEKAKNNSSVFGAPLFLNRVYWSSSVPSSDLGKRNFLNFAYGTFFPNTTGGLVKVRCVRDLN